MERWYLIDESTKPNMIGGFENKAFRDYKNDAFMESLSTDIASTVLLYNHDLSRKRKIRAIIQDNVANTQLKSMERSVLVPIGTLRAGDYIFFENEYWLVNGRPGNNKVYEKAVIIECQYLLRWQNSAGRIVERWANLVSASKYDVGENGNHVVFLTSNNYTILVPQDEETFELDGKRVFIDLNKRNPKKVFKITRNDDVLYAYGSHGGILGLIADKSEINLEKDNQELMICDYIPVESNIDEKDGLEIPKQSNVLFRSEIKFSGNAELKSGGNYKVFTGVFKDDSGKEIITDGEWDIIAIDEISDFIKYTISGNQIRIKVADSAIAIGGKIRLVFSNKENNLSTYVDLNIVNTF